MKRRNSIILFLLLLVNSCIFFSHCAKDYSYEGGIINDSGIVINPPPVTPQATYTLSGSPSACIDPAIRGDYFAGQKLTSGNFIELTVDVNSIGTYIIKTDTVNGFSYYTKGEFTKTGKQTVVVPGSGSPAFSRNVHFNTYGENSACQFDLVVLTPGYPATYVLESSYDTSCTGHIVNGTYIKGTPLNATNKVSVRTYVTIPGVYTLATETINGVSFAYTGEFKNTGVIYADLEGSGSPLKSGSFTYHLHIVGPSPLGGSGCNFEIKVD
jgi:hypothetical protein